MSFCKLVLSGRSSLWIAIAHVCKSRGSVDISSRIHLFFFFFKDWLIDWFLCWVFVSVLGLSLVAASRGQSSSRCAGLSLSWPLLLRSTGSRRAGSVVVAHGPNCSVACGIFPDQDSNPCPLNWQADFQPLRHQGSPCIHRYHCLNKAYCPPLKPHYFELLV